MSLVSLVAASYYRRKKQIKSIAAAAATLMRGGKKSPCGAAGYLFNATAPERKFLPSAHR